ncbi:Myblike DNAbinding domain-containing protein [Mortierella sp. AD094]|nr:Myblike DNAbinding domain-containing protein [Mortierella sp. AD094]
MVLVGFRRLLQPAISGSFVRPVGSPLRSTCNRTVLPATTFVPKRFYFPSFLAPSEDRIGWTNEEEELMARLLNEGKSVVDCVNHFPHRTICSIETRMSKIRKRLKGSDELPSKHKPSNVKRWTIKEDTRLRDAIDRHGKDWTAIAEEVIDGKRMGRSATACERRYQLISDDVLRFGVWDKDEDSRLDIAIWTQVSNLTDRDPDGKIPKNLYLDEDLTKVDWREVSESVRTRTDSQCRSHVYKTLSNKNVGPWTTDETDRLVDGIKVYGLKWKLLAEEVKTRSAFQVKQKYYLARGLKRQLGAEEVKNEKVPDVV